MNLTRIEEHLETRNLLEDTRLLDAAALRDLRQKNPEIVGGIRGRMRVFTAQVDVVVAFPSGFPRVLPVVYLEPWDALGYLPHVDLQGNVCYRDAEGALVDPRNPEGIVDEAIELARTVLMDGIRGTNEPDFLDEFEAYWRQLEDLQFLGSFVEPHCVPRKILLARDAKSHNVYLTDDLASVQAFYRRGELQPVTFRRALYVPLELNGVVRPPKPPDMWSVEEIRKLVHVHTLPAHRREIERLVRKLNKVDEVVVLGVPRPSGGRTLIGVQYFGVGDQHPLRKAGKARRVYPLRLNRKDRAFVLPRGGARQALVGQRVLLVGCGAIGGFLAFALAQAGVLNLTLVDPQPLGTENIFRHRLGMRQLGQNKSQALHQELEEALPYLSVASHVGTIEQVLADERIDLTEFDLIVSALGLPNVERWLNGTVHATAGTSPLIVSWLEPYGIGGHALLTQPASASGTEGPGCVECLFAPSGADEPYNRASFAAPVQTFAQNVTGCGSLYIPFGALDAARTAEVAARLAVRTLEKHEQGSPLLSWKGDAADFLAAGYTLAPRFEMDEAALARTRYEYRNPTCAVCGVGLL